MKQQLLHVDVEAENLDRAVEQALTQLDCTRAEVEVEVLQVHSSGVLGIFGRRPARVMVKVHDRGTIVRQVTARLLLLSGLNATTEVVSSPGRIEVHLTTKDPSRLIGHHGQLLDALQSLAITITDRLTEDRTPIQLDVEGYRERRQDFLTHLADRLKNKVQQSGKPAATPPLGLSERRFLHELFKQESGLETSSKQHEGDRKIIILQPRG